MDNELLTQYLLERFPNPDRIGCPDDEVLRAVAEDRRLGDEASLVHMGSCSECFDQYRNYRLDWEEDQAELKKSSVNEFPAAAEPLFANPIAAAPIGIPAGKQAPKVKQSKSNFPLFAIAASLLLVLLGGAAYLYATHKHEETPVVKKIEQPSPKLREEFNDPANAPHDIVQTAPSVDTEPNPNKEPSGGKRRTAPTLPSENKLVVQVPQPAAPDGDKPKAVQFPTGPHMNDTVVSPTPDKQVANLTIDLFENVDSGTSATPAASSVSASLLQLRVILPRNSQAGIYRVSVSSDSVGTKVIAEASATATEQNGHVVIEVALDLHAAKPGTAFLLISGNDGANSYGSTITYPLSIQ